MTDADIAFEEEIEISIPSEQVLEAKKILEERCRVSDIAFDEVTAPDEEPQLNVGIKCGRDTRWLSLSTTAAINRLLSIPFEKYVFLSDLAAICSYGDGTIEAGIRPARSNFGPTLSIYRRLFGFNGPIDQFDFASAKIGVTATQEGLPDI